MPDAVEKGGLPPPIDPDLMFVWRGFHELLDSRPVGMAAGAIPWSELSRWCEDHGIDGVDRLRVCRLLQAMDRVWHAHVSERTKAAQPRAAVPEVPRDHAGARRHDRQQRRDPGGRRGKARAR